MVRQSIGVVALKSVLVDIVGDALFFPVWWYTIGLKQMIVRRGQSINDMARHLALRLLVLNIFKPMFAQYDRAGRAISFFMRLIILAVRSVYFFVYVLLQLVILILWIGAPLLIFYRIVSIYFGFHV